MNKQYLLNTKQLGEARELLNQLENNSASLIFLDPQYEKAGNISRAKDWPLHYQTDYQISQIIKEISRVLKPSAFFLLWVNKTILGNDRILNWLLQAPNLKIVDCLIWDKQNFGLGHYFRSQAEFAFLLQKYPYNSKLFKNRGLGNVWSEKPLSIQQKQHPHQKPKELIRELILATTNEGDLIVDPCAGSFVVLEICQALKREPLGCDLTFELMNDYQRERERERERGKLPTDEPITNHMSEK